MRPSTLSNCFYRSLVVETVFKLLGCYTICRHSHDTKSVDYLMRRGTYSLKLTAYFVTFLLPVRLKGGERRRQARRSQGKRESNVMNDEELIKSFYEGDPEALSMIFERHKEGVFNFAQRMVSNRADAEDVLSDAFMRVCDPQHRFKADASFKTWLYTIVRNACIDRIRGKKKWGSLWFMKSGSDEAQQMDMPSEDETPSQSMQRKETAQYIKEAIAKLPVEQREAVILREYNDLSYDEIAHILGCSLSNVKIIIYRARVQLKNDIPAFIREGR